MANKGNSSPGEKSRFRFILLEGDVAPGELQQFAQAVAAAIRPAAPAAIGPRHPPAALAAPKPPAEEPNLFSEYAPDGEFNDQQEFVPAPAPAPKPSSGAKRVYKSPSVLEDLDLTSGDTPFKTYIDGMSIDGHSTRYLAITRWLKQFRGIQEVGADHIYTCYRFLEMNVPEDVLSIFRSLKKHAWVVAGSEAGKFKITHVGENKLSKSKE